MCSRVSKLIDRAQSTPKSTIKMIEIDSLHPFYNHVFSPYDENKMNDMIYSIKEVGILQPIIVRPYKADEDKYEIIAGHNRWQAAKKADLDIIPAIVRDVDDSEATIIMTYTNFNQRDGLQISEKARAIKAEMDAFKHQGKKVNLIEFLNEINQMMGDKFDFSTLNEKSTVRDKVGVIHGLTREQVYLYSRIAQLIDELLKLIDEKRLDMTSGAILSFIKEDEQKNIVCLIKDGIKISKAQAELLKKISNEKRKNNESFSIEEMKQILLQENKVSHKGLNITYKAFCELLPESLQKQKLDQEKVKEIFIEAMKLYTEKYQN